MIKSLNYLRDCGVDVDKKLIAKLKRHQTVYGLKDLEVCAYYENLDDFYSDWTSIGYTKTEARKILNGKIGEFMKLNTGQIIRFVI